tara:strand:- start:600 stop:854 length:255 start_codon:yes stop_codon:yes gene_type:complete
MVFDSDKFFIHHDKTLTAVINGKDIPCTREELLSGKGPEDTAQIPGAVIAGAESMNDALDYYNEVWSKAPLDTFINCRTEFMEE